MLRAPKTCQKAEQDCSYPGPLSGPPACDAHDPGRSIQLAAKERKGWAHPIFGGGGMAKGVGLVLTGLTSGSEM